MTQQIESVYQQRKADYQRVLAAAQRTDQQLVRYRALVALGVVGLLFYGYLQEQASAYLLTLPLILWFSVLVRKHHNIRSELTYLGHLVQINEQALQRLAGQWTTFPADGAQFAQVEHPYTGDLNIFGQGSLFQYINATNLVTGQQALAGMLSESTEYAHIPARQRAIQELAGLLNWRQQFQAIGMSSGNRVKEPAKLWGWAKEPSPWAGSKAFYLLALIPLTTWLLVLLMAFGLVPTYIPLALFVLQALLVTAGQVLIGRAFQDTEQAVGELTRLAKLLGEVEGQTFQAPLLKELQGKLRQKNKAASEQVQALSQIAVLINLRYSVVYHFINALFFCDLYTMWKLEQWKGQYGRYLSRWFVVLGQLEALASLAGLSHDHPHWVLPELRQGPPFFEAAQLGHPLIHPTKRVCNDVALREPGTIHIITGSNMSGKSTLLRTVGINLVLAYAGAPVCAQALRCSQMNIYTSMRVLDSLEEGVSSFYAELKRIKLVIEAASSGEPLLFLLDEIFRGTNSRDRIAGARTVIKNLAQHKALGFVTTHDLELGSLEKEIPGKIYNFHFTDRIIEQTITFDYRLKEGISQTTNALALMKMVGIHTP